MSMAIKYGMNKRRKMAMGGEACADHGQRGCPECHGPGPSSDSGSDMPADINGSYASGGRVDRIMAKRMSEGGMVANDTPATADAEPADFDVLATDDDLEFHETGANSGDEDGDYASDDPVDRIMMKRKKDRNPRPA